MAVMGPEISYADFMGETPPGPPLRTLTLLRVRIPRFQFLVTDPHYTVMSAFDVAEPIPNEPKPPRYFELTIPVHKLASVARLGLAKLT